MSHIFSFGHPEQEEFAAGQGVGIAEMWRQGLAGKLQQRCVLDQNYEVPLAPMVALGQLPLKVYHWKQYWLGVNILYSRWNEAE